MTNILFIVFQSDNRANGGVKSITHVMQGLVGWNMCALTQKNTDINQEWILNGITTKVVQRRKGFFGIMMFNIFVYKYCKKNKIRIVHCNDIDGLLFSGLGAYLATRRVILNVRNLKRPDEKYSIKWRVLTKLVCHVIALSQEMQNGLIKRIPLQATKISYIYSICKSTKSRKNVGNEVFTVGVCAAFMPRKGQMELLKNCILPFVKRNLDIKFQFVGDFRPESDEYAKQCDEVVKRNGLQHLVEFVGYRKDIEKFYQSFDISLVVSEREGLARAMIESLAHGVPVISFDVCSAKEIISDNNCGIVISNGAYEALQKSILTYYSKADLLKSHQINALNVSNSLFNKERILRQYDQLYQQFT